MKPLFSLAFFCLPLLAAGAPSADAKRRGDPADAPVLRYSMADAQHFTVEGDVRTGLVLDGEELAASLKRGGDGKVARFSGGRLVDEKAGRVLPQLAAFTFAVRIKPEGEFVRRAPVTTEPGKPITLRFFADRSIFEIYANDEVVISAAAFFADPAALKIQINSTAPVTLDAWEMQPLTWSSATSNKKAP